MNRDSPEFAAHPPGQQSAGLPGMVTQEGALQPAGRPDPLCRHRLLPERRAAQDLLVSKRIWESLGPADLPAPLFCGAPIQRADRWREDPSQGHRKIRSQPAGSIRDSRIQPGAPGETAGQPAPSLRAAASRNTPRLHQNQGAVHHRNVPRHPEGGRTKPQAG